MTTNIITEIGMNHMGDEVYANQYLESLGDAHADALTFQVHREQYYAEESHRSLRLSDEYYRYAAKRTKELGMRFGIGLCETEKIPFFEEIGTDFYKILSKDIGNTKLIAAVLATGKPVYVSTGMSSEEEIDSFLSSAGTPLHSNLSLIHTQLSYEDADTNLRAIGRLRENFDVPVAFGLHSRDANTLYASLGFSPSALFFYVKGRRKIQHRDEEHAVALASCHETIKEIRRLGTMMGDGVKRKMPNRIADQNRKK